MSVCFVPSRLFPLQLVSFLGNSKEQIEWWSECTKRYRLVRCWLEWVSIAAMHSHTNTYKWVRIQERFHTRVLHGCECICLRVCVCLWLILILNSFRSRTNSYLHFNTHAHKQHERCTNELQNAKIQIPTGHFIVLFPCAHSIRHYCFILP